MVDSIGMDLETDGLINKGVPPNILCWSWADNTGSGVKTDKFEIQDVINKYRPVFHNAGFDVAVLRLLGYTFPNGYDCTMLMSYVSNPSTRKHSLSDWGDKLGFPKLDHPWEGDCPTEYTDDLAPYAKRDAELCWAAFKHLSEEFEADIELRQLYYNLELPYSWLIMDMEECGLCIDTEETLKFKMEIENEVSDVEQKVREEVGSKVPDRKLKEYKKKHPEYADDFVKEEDGIWYYKTYSEFNPNSAWHKAWALMEKGWEPEIINNDGTPKVDEATLADVSIPLAKKFVEISKLNKILGTFVTPFLDLQDVHGFVRGQFNQTVTITGRLSSSNPNLQNLPARGEMGKRMRSLITVPSDNWCIVGGDLANIEARVLAYYLDVVLGDDRMAQTFLAGEDVHQSNADLWGVDRDMAKKILYLTLYGGGENKLASAADISITRAKGIFKQVDESMPSLNKLKEEVWAYGRSSGYVKTVLGRKLFYKHLNSKSKTHRGRAERQAFNALLQGSAADIMKYLSLKGHHIVLQHGAMAAAAVHDEALYYCPVEYGEYLAAGLTQEWSTHDTPLLGQVPVEAEFSVGTRWSETH
jgi:DNA polymerase-1